MGNNLSGKEKQHTWHLEYDQAWLCGLIKENVFGREQVTLSA